MPVVTGLVPVTPHSIARLHGVSLSEMAGTSPAMTSLLYMRQIKKF